MMKLTPTVLLLVAPIVVNAFSLTGPASTITPFRQPQQHTFMHNNNLVSSSRSSSLLSLNASPPPAGVDEETKTSEKEEMTINGETTTQSVAVSQAENAVEEEEEELSETKKLMKQVKEAGTAGVISYALWELAFWFISVPVCAVGFKQVTGHWPDFSNKEDLEKLGAEAFAFVNFARFAVPLRIGLALSTTPWIDQNVVKKFFNKENTEE